MHHECFTLSGYRLPLTVAVPVPETHVKPLITADATVVQGILQPRAQLPRLANGDSQNSTKRLTAAKLDLFHREVPP
jgi:hypothetical protein